MTTISVVQLPSPHKTVLQQTNNIITHTKDIEAKNMIKTIDRRDVIILKRKRKCSPSKLESENFVDLKLEKSKHILEVEQGNEVVKLLRGVRHGSIVKVKEESSQNEIPLIPIVLESPALLSADTLIKVEPLDDEKRVKLQRPILPNYVTNSENGVVRKTRQPKELDLSSQSSRITKPQSLSIQKRNARERNRVKQVNNGFAALRSRIPDYISKTYGQGDKNKAKKLSKVETLRMAVDYIRQLEILLNFKDDDWTSSPSLSPNYQNSFISSPSTPCDQSYVVSDETLYIVENDSVLRMHGSPEQPVNLERIKQESPEYLNSMELAEDISGRIIKKESSEFINSVELVPTGVEDNYITYNYIPNDDGGPPGKLSTDSAYSEYIDDKLPSDVGYTDHIVYNRISASNEFDGKLQTGDEYVGTIKCIRSGKMSPDDGYVENLRFEQSEESLGTNESYGRDDGLILNNVSDGKDCTSPLPSINETFSKSSLTNTFFQSDQYMPYELINLSKKNC